MSARKGWPALKECLLFFVKHHFLSSESLSEHLFAEPEHRLIDQALSDLSPLFFSDLLFAIGGIFSRFVDEGWPKIARTAHFRQRSDHGSAPFNAKKEICWLQYIFLENIGPCYFSRRLISCQRMPLSKDEEAFEQNLLGPPCLEIYMFSL